MMSSSCSASKILGWPWPPAVSLFSKAAVSQRVCRRQHRNMLTKRSPLTPTRLGLHLRLCLQILVILLLLLHLFQPVKLFPLQLVQFRQNIADRVFVPRDNNVFDRVDTTVGHFDDFVEDDEGGLERGELDEDFDGFVVGFAAARDLLASLAETREFVD